MAKPVEFEGTTTELKPPPGEEDRISPLPVFRNGSVCVSCWELDDEERLELLATGRIFLSVWSGTSQPPVFVGTERSTLRHLADLGGVWKKKT